MSDRSIFGISYELGDAVQAPGGSQPRTMDCSGIERVDSVQSPDQVKTGEQQSTDTAFQAKQFLTAWLEQNSPAPKPYPFRPIQPVSVHAASAETTSTPGTLVSPSTPAKNVSPPSVQTYGSRKGRHHRTATPEQRQLRALTNGAPIYTVGMEPQADRGLLCDFFEQIKDWSKAYTVQLRALNANQVHNLADHAALVEYLAKPSQVATLVAESGMLPAMVAGVVSRFIFTRTIDDHALYLSGHPHAELLEGLFEQWKYTAADSHEERDELLHYQRSIHAAVKDAPEHKGWRTSCAQTFSAQLIFQLYGLLSNRLPASALKERDHRLQELFVKGYRIGFRLRSSAVKWTFSWPDAGTEFAPMTMVNESRMLYGDVLTTMREVMNSKGGHVVRFAVSPTMVKSDFSIGGEKKETVHSALVHVTRKGWL